MTREYKPDSTEAELEEKVIQLVNSVLSTEKKEFVKALQALDVVSEKELRQVFSKTVAPKIGKPDKRNIHLCVKIVKGWINEKQ
ncbi:hypothetical protein [Mastigocladopsis repens]|uniref:hypothetical protein n=1 Tax=Mastigocladopsis repens TaxID=221287 RepID=UPI0003133BE0|nr:hypothetical protein [Mastigocladopsis repens]